MAEAGHNNPPSMVDTAGETTRDISAWLAEHPVIQDEKEAREVKVFFDRGKLCIKDLEDERDGKVRPLNEQVKKINGDYKGPREILSKVIEEVGSRLTAFVKEEKRKREEAAREAARIAEEAELKAREAERSEQDAIGSASSGELGIDIAAHVAEADDAFRDFEKASRAAALAQKETHVKVGGGFSRAISLRQKETLVAVDPMAAIAEMGTTEEIKEAIIKSARAYRKITGDLPSGVEATYTEEI